MNLEIKQLHRRFGSQWAVRDITTATSPGNCVAILGANGAGKSTLLKLIAGWMPASFGRITLDDRLVKPTRASVRRMMMLVDEPIAHQGSAIEIMLQAVTDYELHHESIEDEVAAWFERLGLLGCYGQTAASLSKGQRYKMSMIALFVTTPHVWLLDEPFSCGLDAEGLQCLEEQLKLHVLAGGTVLLTSQWPEHARRLASRVWVLNDGELVWDAPTDQPVDKDLLQRAEPSLRSVLRGLHE